MSDRLIRDELWSSDRWLDLPSDTHRLVYVSLHPLSDDYGNLEGGRRLYRWLRNCTQLKTEEDVLRVMSDLQDAGLVLRYEGDGKDYWHLPRFRNKRQYWYRKCPQSPYPEETIPPNQEHRQKTRRTLSEHSANTQSGVGVGVGADLGVDLGVGVGEGVGAEERKPRASRISPPFTPPDWIPREPWNAWLEMREKQGKPATLFAMKLAVDKLAILRDQGHHPAAVLAQSAFRGWIPLFPVKEDV